MSECTFISFQRVKELLQIANRRRRYSFVPMATITQFSKKTVAMPDRNYSFKQNVITYGPLQLRVQTLTEV